MLNISDLRRPRIKAKSRISRPVTVTGSRASTIMLTEINGKDFPTAHMELGLMGFGEPGSKLAEMKYNDVVIVSGVFSKRPYTDSKKKNHDGYSIMLDSIEVVQ